jgi:putative Mg2+ transporter-C (MgtC) family protein
MSIESIVPEYIFSSFAFKLAVAGFLGGIIGLERDMHGRAAGLRTHLLVSLGAALFMLLSEAIALSYSNQVTDTIIRADPSRIGAQIITGIGFLGAGAIIKSGLTIRGLTTAACLWLSAGIGMSIGAGYYGIGFTATIIGMFALIFLNRVEKLYSKDSYRILEITTSIDTDITELINVVKRENLKIMLFDNEKNYNENFIKSVFTLKLNHNTITDKLSHELIDDLEKSKIKLHKIKWAHQ